MSKTNESINQSCQNVMDDEMMYPGNICSDREATYVRNSTQNPGRRISDCRNTCLQVILFFCLAFQHINAISILSIPHPQPFATLSNLITSFLCHVSSIAITPSTKRHSFPPTSKRAPTTPCILYTCQHNIQTITLKQSLTV